MIGMSIAADDRLNTASNAGTLPVHPHDIGWNKTEETSC